MTIDVDWTEIEKAFKEPFPESEIKVRVGGTFKQGASGIALPYIDARQVMERLDEIVGPENWSDTYKSVDSQSVICELTIYGITKSDAGQAKPDSGTGEVKALKSAVSDALKRAAVKWGIGQFLYSLPTQFEDLKNKRFVRNQRLIVRDILRKGSLATGPGPKPQPAPRVVTKTSVQPVDNSTTRLLTDEQRAAVQEIKVKLKIRDNAMLNPFVVDWSEGKLSTYRDLHQDNIDSFLKFLDVKYTAVA